MADLNDRNQPSNSTAHANNDVWDTVRGHFLRLWTQSWTGMSNRVPGMRRIVASAGQLEVRELDGALAEQTVTSAVVKNAVGSQFVSSSNPASGNLLEVHNTAAAANGLTAGVRFQLPAISGANARYQLTQATQSGQVETQLTGGVGVVRLRSIQNSFLYQQATPSVFFVHQKQQQFASASQQAVIAEDYLNELNFTAASQFFVMEPDGSSTMKLLLTPPGARNQDRRNDSMVVYGSSQANTTLILGDVAAGATPGLNSRQLRLVDQPLAIARFTGASNVIYPLTTQDLLFTSLIAGSRGFTLVNNRHVASRAGTALVLLKLDFSWDAFPQRPTVWITRNGGQASESYTLESTGGVMRSATIVEVINVAAGDAIGAAANNPSNSSNFVYSEGTRLAPIMIF